MGPLTAWHLHHSDIDSFVTVAFSEMPAKPGRGLLEKSSKKTDRTCAPLAPFLRSGATQGGRIRKSDMSSRDGGDNGMHSLLYPSFG